MEDMLFEENNIKLFQGNCLDILDTIEKKSIDMIFADPPYFLSNGGITCKSGKIDKVDKGNWDKVDTFKEKYNFNKQWILKCKDILKDNGTIWICGSMHNIYIIGFLLEELGFRIINNITWQKTNPPPNISCRYFTHSTETIIWAKKDLKNNKHIYNYEKMKSCNNGKQMKDVWSSSTISKSEKKYGNHPTQKPLWLLERIITASTNEGDIVLDPFNGSGTTGVVCKYLNRRYIGIEIEKEFFKISKNRIKEEGLKQITFNDIILNINDNERKDIMKNVKIKPFIKWAGGKTELLPVLIENLPIYINENKKIDTYIEPFVGAGAFFIYIASNYQFNRIVINDINYKLINVYKIIRDNIDELIEEMESMKEEYLAYSEEEKKEMYLKIREEFNNWNIVTEVKQAANFIFINKTCFNGLYRENQKGDYNVPWGQHKKPSIFDENQLREISKLLNIKNECGEYKVIILCGDYRKIDKYVSEKSVVYIDPPYRPITKSGFTSYNKSGFNDDSQIKLAEFFKDLDCKGAKVMLSNSDPKNFDESDQFFDDLYSSFNIQRVNASRMINSKGNGRGKVSEILVKNY